MEEVCICLIVIEISTKFDGRNEPVELRDSSMSNPSMRIGDMKFCCEVAMKSVY